MAYVQLTLSSNKLFVYIKTEKIIEFYADTDKDGLPCTKIITDDGDYTSVTESLSQVFSAITETEKAEVSNMVESIKMIIPQEEEPQPVPDENVAKTAAIILKRYCNHSLCKECIFGGENVICTLKNNYPIYWEIPKGGEEE